MARSAFASGYVSASPANIPSISDCATSIDTPGRTRPTPRQLRPERGHSDGGEATVRQS